MLLARLSLTLLSFDEQKLQPNWMSPFLAGTLLALLALNPNEGMGPDLWG